MTNIYQSLPHIMAGTDGMKKLRHCHPMYNNVALRQRTLTTAVCMSLRFVSAPNCRTRSLKTKQLECGPMPNVMVTLPNIGGASVQRRKVWLTPTTRVLCSNAAKTRNPLTLGGVPQTTEPISAASRPKFTIL